VLRQLRDNATYFGTNFRGFGVKPLAGETPIIPVILGETSKSDPDERVLLAEGVFVTGFGYPVVPQGHARVRCQVSARIPETSWISPSVPSESRCESLGLV